jgi:hypothetical protein
VTAGVDILRKFIPISPHEYLSKFDITSKHVNWDQRRPELLKLLNEEKNEAKNLLDCFFHILRLYPKVLQRKPRYASSQQFPISP